MGIAYNTFMWHLFVLRGLVMMSNFTEINLDSEISMIFVAVVILAEEEFFI